MRDGKCDIKLQMSKNSRSKSRKEPTADTRWYQLVQSETMRSEDKSDAKEELNEGPLLFEFGGSVLAGD
jgi:hypothetical protein